MLSAPPPDAQGFLPAIVARKDAVKKFMEGPDSHKAVHKSDSLSNLAISVVGSNLFPALASPPAKHNSHAQAAEYTTQMLHGMPSPCKIRAAPGLMQSPDINKNQRLARIEMKIDGMLTQQGVESPPTISKSHHRLARIERTIDDILFTSFGPSSSNSSSPQLQRLHGALLNSRSPEVQLSKSKRHRKAAQAPASQHDSLAEGPRSMPSRLSRLENTVNTCLARLSVSQDGAAGAWHWEKFQRLQRIEDRLDQILTTALSGVDQALQSVRLDPIVKRNQLLPHVVLAASAQERRMHALDLMKMQGKGERELQAALAFKADDSSKLRSLPKSFKPARCP
jgi:hypothetical protein